MAVPRLRRAAAGGLGADVTDLDVAIREKLALDDDGHYFRYDSEMIQGAVFAALDLHEAVHYNNEIEYEWHNEPAYDKAGKLIGYVPVKGEKVPPNWCQECHDVQPCATKRAIAKGLGIEA